MNRTTCSGNIVVVPKEKVVATQLEGEFDELKLQFDKRVREAKDAIDELLQTHDPPTEKVGLLFVILISDSHVFRTRHGRI